MKLIIPKIVEKLNLSDYAKEFGDQTMDVWVNPDKEVGEMHDRNIERTNLIINKLIELKAERQSKGEKWFEDVGKGLQAEFLANLEAADKKAKEWYSIIWSQGEDETRVTIEEVSKLAETAKESDPMFFRWICEKTIDMIVAHRVNRKN